MPLPRPLAAHAPAIDLLARAGFATHGILMLTIGALALRYALVGVGGLAGPSGALQNFVEAPFGLVVLLFLGLGLVAHAAWKLIQAFIDPERKGLGAVAVAERVAFGVTGLGYAALAWLAFRALRGEPLGTAESLDRVLQAVLASHLGRPVAVLLGLILLTSSALQVRLALRAGFRHLLVLRRMSRLERAMAVGAGSLGYLALAALTALVGASVLEAAISLSPTEARGWREALWFIAGLRAGEWWLPLMAGGLLCYGAYHILLVRYWEV